MLFSEEDLRNKLQEKDSAIKDLENAITLLKQEHATEHDRLASEVQSLQRQLTEKNTAVSEFETQLRGVHEALQSVEELMKGLELERTELHQRVESLQREVNDKSARITELNQVEARQCDVIDELQQQHQELKRECEQRSEEIAKLNKTVAALQHDKQLLQESINTLQRTTLTAPAPREAPTTAASSVRAQHDTAAPSTRSIGERGAKSAPVEAHVEAPVEVAAKSDVSRVTSPKRTNTHTQADAELAAPVVCFSGFKEGTYDDALKNKLTEFVVSTLKGQVHDTAEFSHHITHVVTPPHTRTLKTLAAVLTCKWLVTPEWLIDAQRAHAVNPAAPLLSPDEYGIRLREAPFKDKTFAIHSSFSLGSDGAAKLKNADIILKVGKGKRVKQSEASVVLVSDELEGHKSNYYSWAQFMEMILAQVPAILKEKPKRKIDKVSDTEAPKHKKAKFVNK